METDVQQASFGLPAHPASAAAARCRTRAWLRGHPVGEDAAETAVLIISELVANAVTHGGGDLVSCGLQLTDGLLRIEVTDHGIGQDRPVIRRPAPDDLSGRGLLLVSTLACAWGVIPAGLSGWTVWAAVRATG
jgi:anti-sigma regulatory factor (Ser/Thr protein kinase)